MEIYGKQKLSGDQLAKQAFNFSLGNIAIAAYGVISGIMLFSIASLVISAVVVNKANLAKLSGTILIKKVKIAKIISIAILILTILLFVLVFIGKLMAK